MTPILVLVQSGAAIAVQAGLLVLFVLLSGLFSAAEASLISTPAYYRRHLVRDPKGEGDRKLGPPNRVFVTVLVGNYVANAAAAVLVVSLTLTLFGGPLWLGLLIAGLVSILLLLTVGELVPRAIATVDPDRTARSVTPWLAAIQRAFYPTIRFFEGFSSSVMKAFGAPLERRVFLDEEELKHMVEVGQEQGVIEEEERDMISAVIEFGDVDVGDVMVPRTDVVAVEASTRVPEIAQTVTETGFSRIPVYEEDLDGVVGVVYGKDVLQAVTHGIDGTARDVMQEALYVPETAALDDTLREMKTRRIHIAIVHDEFGGTAGLVTLEDLLEEIVGDIFDEYDPEAKPIEWLEEDIAILDARMDIDEVNEALDVHLPESEGYETLGGYLFHELGRPGRAGEVVERDGVAFELERVANRRILEVRAKLPKEEPEASAVDEAPP